MIDAPSNPPTPSGHQESRILSSALMSTLESVEGLLRRRAQRLDVWEVGVVESVGQGVAQVSGLPGVGPGDVVTFSSGVQGTVYDLDPESLGVVLLGPEEQVEAGDEVRRTGPAIEVPVGPDLVGRVVDGMGRPLDGGGPLMTAHRRPAESDAPTIMERGPVRAPLQTGIKVVDALVPIGRGQRELILGDRQTGKTALLVDTIINQKDRDVVCLYCAVGQRKSSVARVLDQLTRAGAMSYTALVVAGGDDPAGLQVLAPFTATAIGEYFMRQGRDVLVAYDDLTRHARAYRELSLLLRRPPGREGYPGDIFYLHARLLERATRLREEFGGGSLTALPVAETQAGSISGYIPTNLISITDGQILVSADLFRKGVLPAVDVGRSVSRVGGDAQLPAYRTVVRGLRLAYSQFQELEVFSRFATQLDEATREALVRGHRVREALRQPESSPLDVADQIIALFAAVDGALDGVPPANVEGVTDTITGEVRNGLSQLCTAIEEGSPLREEDLHQLRDRIRLAVRTPEPAHA